MAGVISIASHGSKGYNLNSGGSGGSFDYYISPTGSDSNNGLTTSTPWAITALNTKRATYTGKTVGLMDGTYDLSTLFSGLNSYYQAALEVDGGTSGAPTIIKAVNAPSSGTWHVTLDVVSQPTRGPAIMRHGGSMAHQGYLIIDGIKFYRYGTGALSIGDYNTSSNLQGCIVRNCEFTGQNCVGYSTDNMYSVEINCANGCLLDNNYIHDNVGLSSSSADHLHPVLGWKSQSTTVQYCTMVNTGDFHMKENDNQGTTLQYCYIDASAFSSGCGALRNLTGAPTAGLTLASSIHHCVLVANAGVAALASTTPDKGPWTTPLAFYNNTCVIVDTGLSVVQSHLCAPVSTAMDGQLISYNNIMAYTGSALPDRRMVCSNAKAWGKCAYNVIMPSGSRFRIVPDGSGDPDGTSTDYSTLSAYRTAVAAAGGLSTSLMELGTVESSQSLSSLFAQTGSGANYWKLKAGSDAINAGKSDGTSSGTTCDTGAWGNQSGTPAVGCSI